MHRCTASAHERSLSSTLSAPLESKYIAAIMFYTSDFQRSDYPFYSILNNRLRQQASARLAPFLSFTWLLLHALKRCPIFSEQTVYRGVKESVKALYPVDSIVTWASFSSCTSNIEIQNQFLGSSGTRTLFVINTTSGRARVISPFSLFEGESEVMVPVGTQLRVMGSFDAGGGLTIIQFREMEQADPILPFVQVSLARWSVCVGGGEGRGG
jgi:hypothetical protein